MAVTQLDVIRKAKIEKFKQREYYLLRSLLGNTWASLFYLVGGREAGKSYSVLKYFLNQYKKKGTQFVWLRLTDTQQKKLLKNNAFDFVDPDLRRKFGLNLTTKGNVVYNDGKPMARILALSNFYNDKGVGMYDNEYKGEYLICLDEMNKEKAEKKFGDILYSLSNQIENIIRSRKTGVKIFLIGNLLEDTSDVMASLDFIPEKFGRYYLRKKKAIIDYIPPSEAYLKRREGAIANILTPNSSTFTNELHRSIEHITKRRLHKPTYVVQFNETELFTVWDSNIVAKFNKEKVPYITMRPYLDKVFNPSSRDAIITQYNAQGYYFHDLITQTLFKKALSDLKPAR